jgi:hypothetical protein
MNMFVVLVLFAVGFICGRAWQFEQDETKSDRQMRAGAKHVITVAWRRPADPHSQPG